jgi:hypothetical protein
VRLEIPGANMRRSNPDLDKYKELYGESIAATPKGANPGLQKSVLRKIRHAAKESQRLRDSTLKLNNQSSTHAAKLFAIANGNKKATSETERVQAVNELLDEYRSQLAKKINDPLLWQGIKDWGLRIFAKRDATRHMRRCQLVPRLLHPECHTVPVPISVRLGVRAGVNQCQAANMTSA